MTSIGHDAFIGCVSLTTVIITDIATWCIINFDTSGASNPFYYAKHLYINGEEVKDLVIPDGVTCINNRAFVDAPLFSVTIPNSVKTIGELAFYGCDSLTSVTFPNSDLKIGGQAFSNSGLTSLEFPEGFKFEAIDANAFWHCDNLVSITFPNSMREINEKWFAYCKKLSAIHLGDFVNSIKKYEYYIYNNTYTYKGRYYARKGSDSMLYLWHNLISAYEEGTGEHLGRPHIVIIDNTKTTIVLPYLRPVTLCC